MTRPRHPTRLAARLARAWNGKSDLWGAVGFGTVQPDPGDPVTLAQWEYTWVTTAALTSTSMDHLSRELNRLGAEGWEVVGFASADKTVGFNSINAVLKRRVVAPEAPADRTPGWRADPTGRHDKRHWDGTAWSAHVANASDKKVVIDPPTLLAPPSSS